MLGYGAQVPLDPRVDPTNRRLLQELVLEGRKTIRSLAAIVGLSEPAVRDRVNALEHDGIIRHYSAVLEPSAVDAGTLAYVSVQFASGQEARADLNEVLLASAHVLEVHEVAGDDCYLLKIRVSSLDSLADALEQLRAMPQVLGTRSTVVLRTIVERPVTLPAEE